MNKITVIGAIVSKNGVTLFQNNGESQVLSSEGYRTQAILDATLVHIAKAGSVEIDLDEFNLKLQANIANENVKVSSDLTKIEVKTKVGTVDVAPALKKQVERATVSKSAAKALKAFAQALSKVKRKHSAEELMKWIERHDLPLAEDGSIIGFKTLTAVAGEPDIFVDGHTKKVRQRLGSYVYMDVKDVDDDRRRECSTGLHIMSRTYSFGGNRLCLVKIRPQDIIAVPFNETNKMRVAAYHIVAVLSDDTRQKLREAKNFQEDGSVDILKQVIAGNHPGILERVWVGANGEFKSDLIVGKTKLRKAKVAAEIPEVEKPPVVDPKKAKQQIKDARATIKAAESGDLSMALTTSLTQKAPLAYDPNDTFEVKLKKAFALKGQGKSIRDIAKLLKMDRETLGKKFKAANGAERDESPGDVLNPTPEPEIKQQPFVAPVDEIRGKNGYVIVDDVVLPSDPYEVRLAEARRRHAAGESIRVIAKALRMDRESLGKKLKG